MSKQCTVTKLGWVHSAHTQNPGRTHTAHAVPMSWALLRAQQACRAHVSRTTSAGRAHSAQVVGACRDLPALPSQTAQVATSFPGCDLLEAIPCRDITLVSRHRLACLASSQVATPEPGEPVSVPGCCTST